MKRKSLILAAALVVAAIAGGAIAAIASDSAPAATTTRSQVVPAAQGTSEPAADADDADDAEDSDGPGEDGAEGPDQPITGPDLERASAAALAYVGEGRVTETEIEDEESYYEVEVTLDDGRQIDVQLDEAFNVVGTD